MTMHYTKNNQNDKSVTSEKQDEKIAHNAFNTPDSVSILPQPTLEVERQEHNIQPDDNNVTEVVPESGIQILDIASIDRSLQVRQVDEATVEAYTEAMKEGEDFPPVDVAFDPETNTQYLTDGFHRVDASSKNGATTIAAKVITMSKKEARWSALGANRTNGRRLSPEEIEVAVEIADKEYPGKSTRVLAKHLGCAHSTVHKYRKPTCSPRTPGDEKSAESKSERVTGEDGKSYPARNTRKMQARKPSTPTAETHEPSCQKSDTPPAEPPDSRDSSGTNATDGNCANLHKVETTQPEATESDNSEEDAELNSLISEIPIVSDELEEDRELNGTTKSETKVKTIELPIDNPHDFAFALLMAKPNDWEFIKGVHKRLSELIAERAARKSGKRNTNLLGSARSAYESSDED